MLPIEGINITSLPFEELAPLQELLVFDDIPILVHYNDKQNSDIISYLVDFDVNGKRILYAKLTKTELFDYLIGSKSLKSLFSEISSEYLFFADIDNENNFRDIILVSKHLMPEKYFPNEDSFHEDGINDFYIAYLKENYYYYRLKEESFIIKVEPIDRVHGRTVGAKEAAMVLNNTSNSVEGYVRALAFNLMKDDFGNVNKLNRRITTTKNFLSPRIAEIAFGSVEVWLAIDTLVFHGQDKYDSEIRKDLVSGYKQDVLDVDYTSEEDAKIIAQKFTEDQRKMIFEPIYRLIENDDLVISISDTKNTIKRNNRGIKSSKLFWETLLPAPTIEQLQSEQERKNKIVQVVLNLKEDENISKLTKKDIKENLLFFKENAEVTYDINSPIAIDDRIVELSKPIKCILTIDENNHLQLFNDKLEIYFEGTDFNLVVNNFKNQFLNLIDNLKKIEEKNYPLFKEIKSHLK